jgi:branched-chain amino acid transport system permease protein
MRALIKEHRVVDVQFWLIQAFNGISYGALLFLLASGLTLIFGVMRIVNLAHGSYFLLGGYVALSVIWTTRWPSPWSGC